MTTISKFIARLKNPKTLHINIRTNPNLDSEINEFLKRKKYKIATLKTWLSYNDDLFSEVFNCQFSHLLWEKTNNYKLKKIRLTHSTLCL